MNKSVIAIAIVGTLLTILGLTVCLELISKPDTLTMLFAESAESGELTTQNR